MSPDVRRERARLRKAIRAEREKVEAEWDRRLAQRDLDAVAMPASKMRPRSEYGEICARIIQGIDIALACLR